MHIRPVELIMACAFINFFSEILIFVLAKKIQSFRMFLHYHDNILHKKTQKKEKTVNLLILIKYKTGGLKEAMLPAPNATVVETS